MDGPGKWAVGQGHSSDEIGHFENLAPNEKIEEFVQEMCLSRFDDNKCLGRFHSS